MPLDYSKFDNIGDSDSDNARGELDLSGLFPGAASAAGDDDAGSPPESPRVALARAAAGGRTSAPALQAAAEGMEASALATLERFALLAEGIVELVRGEDSLELLALARATAQSALVSGDGGEGAAALLRLIRSLTTGLNAKPKPVTFAKEQAPELIGELLTAACDSADGDTEKCVGVDARQLVELLVVKCRPQEVYTFLLEALCGSDLLPAARVRGVDLLRTTLLAMQDSKRHMFLGSCFPALLKRSLVATISAEFMPTYIDALRNFAVAFVPDMEEDIAETDPATIVMSMVSVFLLKLLPQALPVVAPIEGLELALCGSADADAGCPTTLQGELEPKKVCSPSGIHRPGSASGSSPAKSLRLRRPCGAGSAGDADAALTALCTLARDGAAASSRGLLPLLEEIELGDPTGDGGGDLEISPLCLSLFVLLTEMPLCWHRLQPQVLPVMLSPARRLNVLMRSCYVLVSHTDDAPDVVDLGEACTNTGSGSAGGFAARPRWVHRGLELFGRCAGPMLHLAAAHNKKAFQSLSGPLCRWHPQRTFQALLEALASTGDIEREARGALFCAVRDSMQRFAWPCRFEMYRNIIKKCRVDSIIGAVVTMFKDDWWSIVQAMSPDEDRKDLPEERARLIEILKATLSGDVQIVDGMDTLTASLNIARLVALARAPAGAFLRASLRTGIGAVANAGAIDLDALLRGVSQQIDFELRLLDASPGVGGEGLADLAARAMGEALGRSGEEAAVDLQAMKRDRITMVAHLVARVREVFAAAE
eukprot:CAMPEP_0203912330 /NCGR_PEP_ID=MMETSP0359-20131031/53413_1 /ASSEMBLY_ACC=CAM_ASM_000338 /TAXON_ID=268821 /ORGANISM="Scrippsiella Hangoei, Strain SHTV-5" /LENGTH=769 /DNA_ID=CAMNT_0050838243 /DNA_START=56 /DNA_END=2362 /DNA_ORIENTATION=-